jgi:hypothetical protein
MKHDVSPLLEPPRLLRDGSALERQLLMSARRDAAPAGARERMAAALGPVLVDTPALQGMEGPSRGEWLRGAFTPRAALLGLAGAGIATSLLLSVLSPRAAVSPALTRSGPPEVSTGVPAVISSRSQLAPAPDEHPVSAGAPATLAASPELTEGAPVLQKSAPQRQHRAPSVKLATAGAVPQTSPATASTGSLLEEVRLLDAIRSALGEGQLEAASRALGRYDQRFPRGELRLEKSVLALELLLATGQHEAARARARELLQGPGVQRYAARLRAIAESSSTEADSESGSDTGDAHIRGPR